MPRIVVATSVSSSKRGDDDRYRLPSSISARGGAERLPRERREQPDEQAEERRDDDRVPPAARRRLHRRRTGEHLRPLDFLRLDRSCFACS